MTNRIARYIANNKLNVLMFEFMAGHLAVFLFSSLIFSLAVMVKYLLRGPSTVFFSCILFLFFSLIAFILFKRYLIYQRTYIFILCICLFSLIVKISLVLLSLGYPQVMDYDLMHSFASFIREHGIDGTVLSKHYTYSGILPRVILYFLPMRYLFGNNDIFAVQIANCVISTFSLVLVYYILKDIVIEDVRRLTIFIMAIFPLHNLDTLNYTHDIPGNFLFLICVFFILLIIEKYHQNRAFFFGILLGMSVFFLRLQRGIHVVLFAAVPMLVFHTWISENSKVNYRRLLLILFAVPALVYIPASKYIDCLVNKHDLYHLQSGLFAFVARGSSMETLGDYNDIYRNIDLITPRTEKVKTQLRVIFSQIKYNTFHVLGILPPVKIAKFFRVGYLNAIEDSLLVAKKNVLSDFSRGARLLFSPLFLGLACLGCVYSIYKRIYKSKHFFLVVIPIVACLAVTFFGEASPRYSYFSHFIMAMLAATSLCAVTGEKVQGMKKESYSGMAGKIAGYIFFSVIVYFILSCVIVFYVNVFGTQYIFQDMRKATFRYKSEKMKNDFDAQTNTLKPFEQWLFLPSGRLKQDDYVEGRLLIDLPKDEFYQLSMYLFTDIPEETKLDHFSCVIYLDGEVQSKIDLSELKEMKRFEYHQRPKNKMLSLSLRVVYSGEKICSLQKAVKVLRWGYLSVQENHRHLQI